MPDRKPAERMETGAGSVEAVSSGTDAAIDGITIGQQQAIEAIEAAGQAVADGVTRLQLEIAAFASGRIRHDLETQQAMLRCRSFDEVRAVQTAFLRTAVDQYSAEAGRLMRLGTEIVQRSFERPA